jgi:hypothetical protein
MLHGVGLRCEVVVELVVAHLTLLGSRRHLNMDNVREMLLAQQCAATARNIFLRHT